MFHHPVPFSIPLIVFHQPVPYPIPLFVSTAQYRFNSIICVPPPSTFFYPNICVYRPVPFQFRYLCLRPGAVSFPVFVFHHPVPFSVPLFCVSSTNTFFNPILFVFHQPVPFSIPLFVFCTYDVLSHSRLKTALKSRLWVSVKKQLVDSPHPNACDSYCLVLPRYMSPFLWKQISCWFSASQRLQFLPPFPTPGTW